MQPMSRLLHALWLLLMLMVRDGDAEACPSRASVRSSLLGHTYIPYTDSNNLDVWDALKQADADPANASLVRLFYSRGTRLGSQEYDSGGGWTREHLWPQSLMAAEHKESMQPVTDIHALRPALASCNSRRNNHRFGTLPTVQPDAKCHLACDASDAVGVCEPADTNKGQIARALFYMAIRYDRVGDVSTGTVEDWYDLVLDNVTAGGAPLLLEWDAAFPPSADERHRNDVVQRLQGVRNPFIDTSPGLARCLFGNATSLLAQASGASASLNSSVVRGVNKAAAVNASENALDAAARNQSQLEDHHEFLIAAGCGLFVVGALSLANLAQRKCKRCAPGEMSPSQLLGEAPSTAARKAPAAPPASFNGMTSAQSGSPSFGAAQPPAETECSHLAGTPTAASTPDAHPDVAPDAQLPSGWEAYLDDDSGETYYHNKITGVVQWELPKPEPQVKLHQSHAQIQMQGQQQRARMQTNRL
jgi:endonuclease I